MKQKTASVGECRVLVDLELVWRGSLVGVIKSHSLALALARPVETDDSPFQRRDRERWQCKGNNSMSRCDMNIFSVYDKLMCTSLHHKCGRQKLMKECSTQNHELKKEKQDLCGEDKWLVHYMKGLCLCV